MNRDLFAQLQAAIASIIVVFVVSVVWLLGAPAPIIALLIGFLVGMWVAKAAASRN